MEIRRYIFKQMLYWVAVSTFTLISFAWLSQALNLIELLVNKPAALTHFFSLSILAIPYWIMVILPIAGIIATISVLNKLQQDSEITAMQAAGLSNFKIASAPILLGISMTLFLIINSALILPISYSNYKSILYSIRNEAPIVVLQEGIFTDITKGLTIFIGKRQGRDINDIFVYDAREKSKYIEIIAQKAQINGNSIPPQIIFFDGIRSEYEEGATQASILKFQQYELSLKRDHQNSGKPAADYNELPIHELLTSKSTRIHFAREKWAEGHFRLASPFIALSLVMIGVISILNQRYSRTRHWKNIAFAAALATAITIALFVTRSITIKSSSLFPLIYIVSIAPTIIGFYMLADKKELKNLKLRKLNS